MSDGDILDEQWARDGMAEVDKAIAECNIRLLPDRQMRIAWGWPSKRDDRVAVGPSLTPQHQAGLLDWNGHSVDLSISNERHSGLASGHDSYCKQLVLYEVFKTPANFPDTPNDMTLAIIAAYAPCGLLPSMPKDVRSPPKIGGVIAALMFDEINWRVFLAIISKLISAFEETRTLLFPSSDPPEPH